MDEISKRLQALVEAHAQKEKIEGHIEILNQSISNAQEEIDTKMDKFFKENQDVEKLEGSSLRKVFLHYLGKEDEALDHEKQERLWAFMSLDKAKQALELLKFEKSILVRKLIQIDYDADEYQRLLKEKEKMLRDKPQNRIKLSLIDMKLAQIESQLNELNEVLVITDELAKDFNELSHELQKISNWNQAVFNYSGKGHYSSFKKKKYVEKNLRLIPRIYVSNEKLIRELQDLKKKYEIDFSTNLTLLNNFFELFLDNLITDWIVRNGLISSIRILELSQSKLNSLQMMLQHEMITLKKKREEFKMERKKIVLSSHP